MQDIGLDRIEQTAEGGLRIGTLVTNTRVAADPRRPARPPDLVRAIIARASGQLRGKATTGGNRFGARAVAYFYDTNQACNKEVAVRAVPRSAAPVGNWP